jgi:hypothetical protein
MRKAGIQKICGNCFYYCPDGVVGCALGKGNTTYHQECKISHRFIEKIRPPHRVGGSPAQWHIIHGEKPKDLVEFRDKKGKKVSFKKGSKKSGDTKSGKKKKT